MGNATARQATGTGSDGWIAVPAGMGNDGAGTGGWHGTGGAGGAGARRRGAAQVVLAAVNTARGPDLMWEFE